MTRYTKLDGRHQPLSKSSAEERGEGKRKAGSLVDDDDDGSRETARHVSSSSANKGEQKKILEREAPDSSTPTRASHDDNDPSKLLKRAKLLRLKAKKAKTPEKRAELEKVRKETERRAHTLNGERGISDKGKGKAAKVANSAARRTQGRPDRQRDDATRHASLHENAAPSVSADGDQAAPVNPWKAMEAERRVHADARTAYRREKRASERAATQMCFACRQTGHAAKDCPQSQADGTGKGAAGAATCCYRCGSAEHALKDCRKPASNGLPFAQCFICKEQGHLASQCSQNAHGIYPRGGSCKVCGSVEHLANDCPLDQRGKRKQTDDGDVAEDVRASGPLGADDDDYHAEAAAKMRKKPRREAAGTGADAVAGTKKAKKVVTF